MILIDGKKVAEEIKQNIKIQISELKEENNKLPGLVTIIVGDNPASQVYVNMKSKTCIELGMNSKVEQLDGNISEEVLLTIIDKYNKDENFHGILVQLPLPKHIDEDKVIEKIIPEKDVDGFHPINVGNLVIGKDTLFPCTPYGILKLLEKYHIETKGRHVVVVGRSNIVGKPVANLLLQKKDNANAIVTVCHSATSDISKYTKQADILIAAMGKPKFITENMVKENAVVVDVGTNRVDDPTAKKGYRIVGDVDFDNVSKKVSHITPVPGGVGPMTIAMLMYNTLKAYQRKNNL
ncbi:MAG: bifunctional methylenetetrahydrofolate dehydrogenase/methenyltetrahydrofolate cyclohydrolase FolD [Ignavibacteriales bacterium]|nr:bifunctional methylenetetrahydrofolate dehydrogenase/methenyltetrahydrofolate cyclohydrolase FolD [Ignavibacteriales bacterium]